MHFLSSAVASGVISWHLVHFFWSPDDILPRLHGDLLSPPEPPPFIEPPISASSGAPSEAVRLEAQLKRDIVMDSSCLGLDWRSQRAERESRFYKAPARPDA